jgi:hypothetical protein
MYALHSIMSTLDYATEPSFVCPDDDSGDAAFILVAILIGGRDAVEEYLVCGMHSLLANFGFDAILDGETPMSKLIVPQPEFHIARAEGEGRRSMMLA